MKSNDCFKIIEGIIVCRIEPTKWDFNYFYIFIHFSMFLLVFIFIKYQQKLKTTLYSNIQRPAKEIAIQMKACSMNLISSIFSLQINGTI